MNSNNGERKKLSPQESKALSFMKQYLEKNGYMPVLREIAEAIGAKNNDIGMTTSPKLRTSIAARAVDRIIMKGYATKTDRKCRGIRIIE